MFTVFFLCLTVCFPCPGAVGIYCWCYRVSFLEESFLFLLIRPPPTSPLFPYTTLFRSNPTRHCPRWTPPCRWPSDRKSTRLNSSHVAISYAVFGVKKKIQIRGTAVSDLLERALGREHRIGPHRRPTALTNSTACGKRHT